MIEENYDSILNDFINTVYDSIDQAVERSLERGLTGLPAKIITFDASKMEAQVQVMIQYKDENGSVVSPQPIPYVPVSAVYGGKFIFFCEINPGDEGWLDFSNRSIDTFMNQSGPSLPDKNRYNSLSDCKFTPNIRSNPNVPKAFNNEGCAISSLDGSKKVHLTENSIIASFGQSYIKIDGESVTIYAGGNSITINGSGVSVTGSLTNDGVNVGSDHVHGGVRSGPSTTGVPR